MGNWKVKIADMDSNQGTSTRWNMLRNDNQVEPAVKTEQYRSVSDAVSDYNNGDFHLLIFDGAPAASKQTLSIAKYSDLLILPAGISADDLEPTVRLAHELVKNGIQREQIIVVFCRVGDSHSEIEEARSYISMAGYISVEASLSERVAYRRAHDSGRSVSETSFASLNNKAALVAQEIVNHSKIKS